MKTLIVYQKTAVGYKRELLNSFGKGAEKHGIKVEYRIDDTYKDSDYALVFAYRAQGMDIPTHLFRERIYTSNSNCFFIDSNVLKYYEKPELKMFRLPFKSIHPHEADFLDIEEDTKKKAEKIKRDYKIDVKEWRTKGNHILLSLNRGVGGFSSFGKPCYEWARETIQELRKYTDRPILIRSHNHVKVNENLEEDRKNLDWIMNNVKDVRHTSLGISDIDDDLNNAWATVVFTTTSGAVSLLKGIPTFTLHPACFFHKFGSGNLSNIENPELPNRDDFLNHYANAHWSQKEMEDGTMFEKFMRQRCR